MIIKNSRFVFRSGFLALVAALCLSLVLLTGCGKADAESEITPPSDSVQSEDEQVQDESESESDDSGFVIEDTSVVEVDINEE